MWILSKIIFLKLNFVKVEIFKVRFFGLTEYFCSFFQAWVFCSPSYSVATFGNFTMRTHCFISAMSKYSFSMFTQVCMYQRACYSISICILPAGKIPLGKFQLYAFSFSCWALEISSLLLGPFLLRSEKPIWGCYRWGSPDWTSTFGIIANLCSRYEF